MAFDYDEIRETAEELIEEFGGPGFIRRATNAGGPYAPDPVQSLQDYPCTLVVLEYSLRERDSTLIKANDRKVLVSTAGLTIAPTESDRLIIGGQSFEIVSVAPLSPAGVTLLYEIQARS